LLRGFSFLRVEAVMDSDKQEILNDAIVAFPKEFGLKAFPERKFRISVGASYIYAENIPVLYLEKQLVFGDWIEFCKCSPAELKSQIVYL
jgi:hypothetical protein